MKFPGAGLAIGLCLLASSTLAADKVSFGTNWLAEAEHGGYYQAVADGTYAKYGLDVTIVQGGPQANNELLLAAGRLDFYMGGNLLLAFDAVARDVPIVVVAADFQKDPQIFMSHPGRRTRHMGGPAEGDGSFRRQGRAGHLLPVDELGLWVQGGSRQALYIQPWAIHRRHPFDSARLRDLRAVRRRARRSLQAQHLPARPTTATGPTRRRSRPAPIWSRTIPTSFSGSSTRPRSAGTTISTATIRKRMRRSRRTIRT